MPLILAVQTLITFTLALHVYRTGRPLWWIGIIFMFPLLGALAYVFLEILPGSPQASQLVRGVRSLKRRIDPTREFRAKADDVERCGSVANKIDLATECIELGYYDQAIALLRSSLSAQFANDLHVRHLLALAYYGNEQYAQTAEHAAAVIEQQEWFKSGDTYLLLANAYADAGRLAEADAAFHSVVPRYVGEEARSDYVVFLMRNGRITEARAVLDEMRHKVRLNGKPYARRQKHFIDAAETAVAAGRNAA
jgi:hypothetical protein